MARQQQSSDIVTDIIDRVSTAAKLDDAAARRLEREIRRTWGGNGHYIAKHGESAQQERLMRDESIRYEARRGEPIPLLAHRYGVSEKRVRQIIAAGNNLP